MLEEIKKIKLEEYKSSYIEKLSSLNNELVDLEAFKQEYSDEKRTQLNEEFSELNHKTKNFFMKIFQRKRVELFTKRMEEITQLLIKLNSCGYSIADLKAKINDIEYDINNYHLELEKKDLRQLGFTFEDACVFLRQHNIEPTLTIDDQKYLNYENENYQSHLNGTENGIDRMKDYVLVHKTRFYPKDGKIRTDRELGIKNETFLSLDRIGSLKFSEQRNTIHFAVNGEVGSHFYGNWDDCQYAVIIPFANIPVNQLKCGNVVDTYIENGLNLPKDTIILCPKEKVEEVRSHNTNINVLGYDGTNAMNYANTLVGMLGYEVERVGMWSWTNDGDAQKFYDNLRESNLGVYTGPHMTSLEKNTEDRMNCVMTFESLLEKLLSENIVLTDEEIASLLENNRIALVSSLYSSEVQPKVFNELIPFLNRYGITINNDIMEKVMFYANNHKESTNDYRSFEENAFEQGFYGGCNYVNYLLISDILNKVKEKVCTQSEKSR